jgi:hypothetical protein
MAQQPAEAAAGGVRMSNKTWARTGGGKTKRRKSNGPTFVQLFHWMIKTPAWRSLSSNAVVAWVELANRYDGTNNGQLHLSCRELAKLRPPMSRATAARALQELVDTGFVHPTKASGFNVKDRKRQATEYALAHLFCNATGQPASKEFASWKPEVTVSPITHSKNISRSHQRATNVSLVRRSRKTIEENDPTVSPMRPKPVFSDISRSHPRDTSKIYHTAIASTVGAACDGDGDGACDDDGMVMAGMSEVCLPFAGEGRHVIASSRAALRHIRGEGCWPAPYRERESHPDTSSNNSISYTEGGRRSLPF